MASNFPSKNKLSAIVLEASLKRSGLVADCIFPQVQTDCRFDYIDWTSSLNVKEIEDAITCKSDVKEIDPEVFKYVSAKLDDHALSQAMTECCVSECGSETLANKRAQGKTLQLTNRLLIGHEKRAIALATDESKYTANGTSGAPVNPGAPTAVNEGGLFYLPATNLADPNFQLLQYLQPIQTNNFLSGVRNVAVMNRDTLNKLLSHPSFIGIGCALPATTTIDKVAAALGVQKICVADAGFNNGVGANVQIQAFWPSNYILFTSSYEMQTSDEAQVSFGFTGYNRNFKTYHWLDEKKGPTEGVEMQKQSHDLTPIVLSYKAATLVKIV